jgi:hypothetical protein
LGSKTELSPSEFDALVEARKWFKVGGQISACARVAVRREIKVKAIKTLRKIKQPSRLSGR